MTCTYLMTQISDDVAEIEHILKAVKGDVMRAANILLESRQWARKSGTCKPEHSTMTQVNNTTLQATSSTNKSNRKAVPKMGSGVLDRALSEETVGFCERDVLSALDATAKCNAKSRLNVYKR